MAQPKQYGLIISKKEDKKKLIPLKCSIFGEESDEEDSMAAVNRNIKKESKKNLLKKQTKHNIEKALSEDPNIFDYDGVYDELQETKKATDSKVNSEKTQRKSRYIGDLMKTAEKRNRENERRIERQVQKDREKEKGMYDDKEAFVTSAYKEKMKKIQEEEEKERRMDAIEEAMDVKKQRDLSGFYRHLLNQTTASDPRSKEEPIKEEPTEAAAVSASHQVDFSQDRDLSMDSSQSSDSEQHSHWIDEHSSKKKCVDQVRTYRGRQRTDSSNSDSLPDKQQKNKHNHRQEVQSSEQKNRSRPSRPRSSSSEEDGNRSRQPKSNEGNIEKESLLSRHQKISLSPSCHGYRKSRSKSPTGEQHSKSTPITSNNEVLDDKRKNQNKAKKKTVEKNEKRSSSESDNSSSECEEEKVVEDPMAKYAKRNVGEKLEEARMRYLIRKQRRVIALAKDED